MLDTQSVIARSNATKQSIWIATSASASTATVRSARLAMTIPARAASGLIWVYQRAVSPALMALNPTCGCRFAPTCSHYAREALREHGFLHGSFLAARRLVKCGPWHPGGADPVPRRKPFCRAVLQPAQKTSHHAG